MSDEKPVSLGRTPTKRLSSGSGIECVLCYRSKADLSISQLTDVSAEKIRESVDIRQVYGQTDSERQDSICRGIPDSFDYSRHGYHRKPCYSNFTNISRIQKKAKRKEETAEESVPVKKLREKCLQKQLSLIKMNALSVEIHAYMTRVRKEWNIDWLKLVLKKQ